jgi:hypothetical protein
VRLHARSRKPVAPTSVTKTDRGSTAIDSILLLQLYRDEDATLVHSTVLADTHIEVWPLMRKVGCSASYSI